MTKERWIETRRISVSIITPTSNDEEQRFVCDNNCVVDTYATMTPRISIDDANKDDYDSAGFCIYHLLCRSSCSSIPINEEMITLPWVLYKRLLQSYGERYWEKRLLCYDVTSNTIFPSFGERCKSASTDCDIDVICAYLY